MPTLTDGVVLLNGLTLDDVDEHLAGEDEEQARRFGWYPQRSSREHVRAAILEWQEEWRKDGATRTFGVRVAKTGELAGGCQIRLQDDGIAQASYWTFPPYRRRGFAGRALSLAYRFAVQHLSVRAMELHIEPDNAASRAVARKAEFVERGILSDQEKRPNGERVDMVVYVREANVTPLQ